MTQINVLILMGHFVLNNSLGLVFQADCGYQIFPEEPGRVRFADGPPPAGDEENRT